MGDVVSLKSHKKKVAKAGSKGMCRYGFHKWKIWQDKQFDVQQGKLVTVFRCERCHIQKVEAL